MVSGLYQPYSTRHPPTHTYTPPPKTHYTTRRWKASMAGKPITVLSPEPAKAKKEEPKPEPPPAAPPTKQERMRELLARNKK